MSDKLSTARTLGCGAPQGSVLGHLLFAKYSWLFIPFLRPLLIEWRFCSSLICTEALLCEVTRARGVKKGSWKKVESSPSPHPPMNPPDSEVWRMVKFIFFASKVSPRVDISLARWSLSFCYKSACPNSEAVIARRRADYWRRINWRQVRRQRIAAHHEMQKAGKLSLETQKCNPM